MKLRWFAPAVLVLTLGSVSYAIDGNLVVHPTEGPQVSFPMNPPPVIVVQNDGEQIRISSNSDSQVFNIDQIRKITVEQLTEVPGSSETILPETFTLGDAYPNPFNPSTTIDIAIPRAGSTRISVYDLTGRLVKQDILNFNAGNHHYTFEASANGIPLATGLYLLQANFEETTLTRRLFLVK